MQRLIATTFALLAVLVQAGFGAFPAGDLCFCAKACETKRACCERHAPPKDSACPCHEDCPTCLEVLAPETQVAPVVRVVCGHDDAGFTLDLPPVELAAWLQPPAPMERPGPRANESPPPPHLAAVRTIRLNV